jgi:hypothetical protein
MAWKGSSSASFTGGSGQMAVMAELLHRKCNAAIPQIDVGTDVFAFRDDREDVARIQVKTAPARVYKHGQGYSAKFGVPMAQLRRTDEPPLFYILIVRLVNGWGSVIVISRTKLQELWDEGCGSVNEKSGDLELHIRFRPVEKIAGPHEYKCSVRIFFDECVAQLFKLLRFQARKSWHDLSSQFHDAAMRLLKIGRSLKIDGDDRRGTFCIGK